MHHHHGHIHQNQNCMLTRRRLIGGAAALGGALLDGFGRAVAAPASKPWLIDTHHHIFPPQFLRDAPKSADQFRRAPEIRDWSISKSLEEMDRDGIAVSVLSFSQPTFWSPEIEAQRKLARLTNDFYAGLIRDQPRRFGLFASLPPLTDTEGCLKEIEYAFDTLNADGVRAMTSYATKWLGDPSFAPVMDELARRRAILFVHPDVADCCRNLMTGIGPNYIEYPIDTARAGVNLWINGAFDRWPQIRIILSHGGGALPMMADRAAQFGRPNPHGGEPLKDAMAQFRSLYVDTANAVSTSALLAAAALVPSDHFLFGTDDPFVSITHQLDRLHHGPFGAAQLRAIGRENAVKLLPKFATS